MSFFISRLLIDGGLISLIGGLVQLPREHFLSAYLEFRTVALSDGQGFPWRADEGADHAVASQQDLRRYFRPLSGGGTSAQRGPVGLHAPTVSFYHCLRFRHPNVLCQIVA
jgi:hypothetical protein